MLTSTTSCRLIRNAIPNRAPKSQISGWLVRWALVLLLPVLLPACSVIGVEDHPIPGNQKVQDVINRLRADLEADLKNQVPSLNVLIQTPKERIFVSSVPAGNAPVTETTNFRFASNTKNFTATAVLNMYEDGWLDIKAKIADLIPGTSIPYVPNTPAWAFPFKNTITIEQLLQHSAGVYDVDNDPVPGFNGVSYTEATQKADPTHQFSPDEMVAQLIAHNLSYFVPGTYHHYSNTGFSILSKIIERVYSAKSGSAKTYADYLYDYVVGAGAKVPVAVRFPIRADDIVLPSPRVEGTILYADKIEKYGDYNMSAQVGEGNGYGNMAAMNTYIRSLMKGQNVLTPATISLMQSRLSPGSDNYALGTNFRQNLGYGHNGARIGNLSLMAYDPLTDVSIVVYLPLWDLSNGNESFFKCFNALYDAAYAARSALGYPGKP